VSPLKPGVLFADDSGSDADALRSLAVLSGPARVFLALERDLRKALALHGVRELKWTAVRTRPARLQAAQACLDLLTAGLAAKGLRCEILLWQPGAQGAAYRSRSEPQRLRPLYAQAWGLAAGGWGLRQWRAYPDQRTGMDWQRWSPQQRRAWKRSGLGRLSIREADSQGSACIQLCDLLAGLARHPAPSARAGGGGDGLRARQNREALLNHWVLSCAARGLPLRLREGRLDARHPHLNVRFLRRLPVRS
jgi:hypothetical protein